MTQRRGRPRAYDHDAALDAALDTFWAHGFDGASLGMLADAMEMNRPSVYAAFGNKEALFSAAMERFGDRLRAHAHKALEEPDLREALRKLLHGLVGIYRPGGQGRGCLVFGVGAAASVEVGAFRPTVARALRDLDQSLHDRFDRAVRDGQLGKDADPEQRAALAASVVHGLSVRARAGARRKELGQFVERCIALLAGE